MDTTKKVLIIGSGMMVEPLIDHLLKDPKNRIKIAANHAHMVKSVIDKKANPKLIGDDVDVVNDKEKLKKLVDESDLVISYIPPILHEHVAKMCLECKTDMLTTSYVGDYMKSIKDKVESEGLIFMNEIGLDPGIDHLITHKVINEAEKNGDKIISYQSWCGALCSPEFLNNPLLYKFSWSPRGALLALKNNAKQIIDNKHVEILSNELLTLVTEKTFHPCFNFEGYYNRDSLHYKNHYNLKDAQTVIRGTIRYQGFAFIFQCLKNLTLFDVTKVEAGTNSWKDYFTKSVLTDKANQELISKMKNAADSSNIEFLIKQGSVMSFKEESDFYYNLSLLALSKFDDSYIKKYGFQNLFNKIYASLEYLQLFDENNKV